MNTGKKSIENSSPLYQTYTPTLIFKNLNLKVDHNTDGKGFIHGPKRQNKNEFKSLKHFCWLLAC